MSLKLLQAEQSHMINRLSNSKALVVNKENIHKHIHKQAAKKGYIHTFTGFEIAYSNKFKKNIFNNFELIDRLCLLVINEIYLVHQWGKTICFLYAKIEKV